MAIWIEPKKENETSGGDYFVNYSQYLGTLLSILLLLLLLLFLKKLLFLC